MWNAFSPGLQVALVGSCSVVSCNSVVPVGEVDSGSSHSTTLATSPMLIPSIVFNCEYDCDLTVSLSR